MKQYHSKEWTALYKGAYCEYGNSISNVYVYGRLYNWYAVTDNRNIAPAGWHVPTAEECYELVAFVNGNPQKLRESDSSHWLESDVLGSNETGFSLVPSGVRAYSPTDYSEMGKQCDLWSASQPTKNSIYGNILSFYYMFNFVIKNVSEKYHGSSIRCIKD